MPGSRPLAPRTGSSLPEFRVLGPLELLIHGRPVSVCGRKRRVVLSALLLSARKEVTVHRLAEATWELEPPASARKQICNTVSDLRRLLAPCGASVIRESDGYRLEIGNAVYDAAQFRRHVDMARTYAQDGRGDAAVGEYRKGLSLWRGPALAGLTSLTIEPELVSLNEERMTALEECIALELEHGRPALLIRELSGLVTEYPLRERFTELLMLSLCRADEYARALAVYEKTRQTLEDELRVAPGPKLQELQRRIVAGAPGVPFPREEHGSGSGRSSLPGHARYFTGRATQLNWIVDSARRYAAGQPEACAVIAIDGMPGVGKTALAVAAGHALAPDYPDGQLYVSLQTHAPGEQPLDAGQALARLRRAMGASSDWAAAEFSEWCAAWRHQLADRSVLIVLDDVASAAQVTSLLPSGARCLALVVSRRRLIGLDYTHQMSLLELSPADGCELFRRVLGDGRAAAEPEAVARVVEICGRLPLGIRIAASRLRHRPNWTVARLAERLAAGRGLLDEPHHEDRSVAGSFDLSYQRLAPAHRRLLRALCQTRSRQFSAADVSGPGDGHLLEELADAHWLEEVIPGSFRMNGLLRQYLSRLPDSAACGC